MGGKICRNPFLSSRSFAFREKGALTSPRVGRGGGAQGRRLRHHPDREGAAARAVTAATSWRRSSSSSGRATSWWFSKLDRLGRNTRDVLNLVHELEQKGACLRVLEPAIDTCGPMGRMVITVLGMVAEMELGFIKERQRAGIEAAKAEGVYKGRPVKFDRARIIELRKQGMGATEIAKAVGCKRGAVYLALKAAA